MTKRKTAVLCSLFALSIAGIGTSVAFIVKGATKSKDDTVDTAMILNWGDKANFSEITNLKANEYQYRTVELKAPAKSDSVTVVPQFTITLSDSASGKMDGMVVDVSTEDWTTTQKIENYDTLDSITKTKSYDVSAAITYYLRVSITQDAYSGYIAEDATTTFGATINLKYEVATTANA